MSSDAPGDTDAPKTHSEPPAALVNQAVAAAAASQAEVTSEVAPEATSSEATSTSTAATEAPIAVVVDPPPYDHSSTNEGQALGGNQTAGSEKSEALSVEAQRPPFGRDVSRLDISQDGFATQANVAKDGRVNINIKQRDKKLSNLLAPALRSQLSLHTGPEEPDHPPTPPPGYIPPSLSGEPGRAPPPPMNVVIHVVGSRGDVQPFVALGKTLKETYHHRVRLATHATFKTFVEENGLEFFCIGGDPAELMAFMVKNPGLMPGFESLRSGDVGHRRKGMYEIIRGCWRSCIEAGDGTGIEPSDDYIEDHASFDSGISVSGNATTKPFVADAIIANPPSFAHIHCAEKLGIPLHLMFT